MNIPCYKRPSAVQWQGSRALRFALIAVSLACLCAKQVHAHFLWLVVDGAQVVQVHFGESAEPDDPDLLQRLGKLQVTPIYKDGKETSTGKPLTLKLADDALSAPLPREAQAAVLVLQHKYGVIERQGSEFLLQYYAKTSPTAAAPATTQLPLDLQSQPGADACTFTVAWQGKPLAKAQVVILDPNGERQELVTDERGQVKVPVKAPGAYSIRTRHIESKSGEHDGKPYATIRHYSTLAITIGEPKSDAPTANAALPEIPEMVTSFGAAVLDGGVYVYGGHMGRAHEYYSEAQARTLRRLDLKTKRWESLGAGPGLQGLAMVAVDGQLVRIGGFTAKNRDGEDSDLWSQAGVAAFHPTSKKWTALPDLPEPRSSFDAAVLDGKVYVVGGWTMAGDKKTWLSSAYALDPSAANPQWEPLPEAPFKRRALSVAAHEGKLYAIGGMQENGGPTRATAIYSPKTRQWSKGPDLEGKAMDGFGSSAFATGGRLYASTYSGKLQRLSQDGKRWEVVRTVERDRFFHRMLPLSNEQLLMIGGASMQSGKFSELDVLDVTKAK